MLELTYTTLLSGDGVSVVHPEDSGGWVGVEVAVGLGVVVDVGITV